MLRVGVFISCPSLPGLGSGAVRRPSPQGDRRWPIPRSSRIRKSRAPRSISTTADIVTAEIRSKLMKRFEAIDSTVAYELDVDFHDSLGAVTSNLVADSGVIREKDDRIEVFGKVVVLTQDSTRLDTDFLRWNPQTHKIESHAFVRFTRP